MKTFKLGLFIVALASFAAACGDTSKTNQTANVNANTGARPAATASAAPAATPDEFATVRATYSQFCIRCHKADGTGGPFELEDGTTLKVPSLREHGLKDSDEHLAKQIRDGGEGMPAFKNRLDEERIKGLIGFIRKEFHGRGTSAAGASSSPAPAH
jgi:mono/diheme cytochrome c family protein